MSKDRLTKEEAIKLITSVVDGEVNEEQRIAFLEYIEQDEEVRAEYESIKRIKKLIAEHCPVHKAPETLKIRVRQFLSQQEDNINSENSTDQVKESVIDVPSHIPDETSGTEKSMPVGTSNEPMYKKWLYAAAASFLIIAAFWGLIYNNQAAQKNYNIEEYVYRHFENNEGKLIPTNISTASLADAEVSLSNNFDMPMTVPPLKNAEFKGVAFNEFVPGYKAPLLEYYLPAEDQYIYIFAFNIDQLNKFENLSRSDEAIKKCVKPEDFHIKNVKGKHVVSWQWNDIWYAAISNHNGKTLASLVEPLKYDTASSD